ncbi:MAG: hypothetical protein JNJ88_15375 [Planctomycetes bacterium]|nr:hypothetical protein [Planctomycetota bacterium]
MRQEGAAELSAPITAELRKHLETPPAPAAWIDLLREALAAEGDSDAFLAALRRASTDPAASDTAKRAALEGLAWCYHAEGRLPEALTSTDGVLALGKRADLLLHRAHLLDALARVEDAIAAYEEAGREAIDREARAHCQIRKALLESQKSERKGFVAPASKPAGAAASQPAALDSALYRWCFEPDVDAEVRNRAAVVLAMLGRHREAIRLYASTGEGTDRFKQEIRLAEWALSAQAPAEAQEHAWRARGEAALKRDRLYALTVLVEAHRADDSIPKLIERFAAEQSLDAESRKVWIDLLRETSRVDEAMALFEGGGRSEFTVEQRRELLEMCREAGRLEDLEATYQKMIEAEPDRVEWREGLSRHYLERGKRDEALAVWRGVEESKAVLPILEMARAAASLGLDERARELAERCTTVTDGMIPARLFLFDLDLRRGRAEQALAQLERIDKEADPKSPARIQLSEAFERVGAKRRAADVLLAVRDARGGAEAEEDLEMRLAWLLSEVGEEKRALEMWQHLWRRVSTIPRRRQAEDRLMAVASRLGVLAEIAVDLEERLLEGKADDREAGLLTRLYTKVGDPASAAEIIEEHLKQKGSAEIPMLEEKARIYLGGKDYYNFERIVRKLVEIDPESKPDRLRQLAMSQLERGRPQEAREVLRQLAQIENPSDTAEFEAGVLALANLHAEAAKAYRRGLARHPERIDVYLLLANTLKALGKTDRAVGIFQYLAETADKDDLFTIAIDGILNMNAKEGVLRWARRVAFERIARRHDKMYLYHLVSDLSEDLEDRPGMLRALEASLAIAGEQRGSVLRELMDISRGKDDGAYMIINGVVQRQRRGGDDGRRLAYGRRLIGLGDLVPPQVYLELGEGFLATGDVASASRAFSMARDVPDYAAFQRQVGRSFESQSFAVSALEVYERAIASQGLDPSLMLKVGELHEQLGRDGRAWELYSHAAEILLAQHALSGAQAKKERAPGEEFEWIPKNENEYDRIFPGVFAGLLAVAQEDQARALFDRQRALLLGDLKALPPLKEGEGGRRLDTLPRVRERAGFLRKLALRMGWVALAEEADLALLAEMPEDGDLLDAAVDSRVLRGFEAAAVALLEKCTVPEEKKSKVLARLGRAQGEPTRGLLPLRDVVARLTPLLAEGDDSRVKILLRSARLTESSPEDLPFLQLLVSAAIFVRDEASVSALTSFAIRATVLHSKSWEDRSRIRALLSRAKKAVSAEAYGVLLDTFVNLVAEKEARFQEYQWDLLELQEEAGRPLLGADVVRKRMEECAAKTPWAVATLVRLMPGGARAAALRSAWGKVPAAERASIVVDMLAGCDRYDTEAFKDVLCELFADSLKSVDSIDSIGYSLDGIAENEHAGRPVISAVLREIEKKWPDEVIVACYRGKLQCKAKDFDGALVTLRALAPKVPTEPNAYAFRTAFSAFLESFEEKYLPAVGEALEALPDLPDDSPLLYPVQRVQYRMGKESELRRRLEEKSLANPENKKILKNLLSVLQRSGSMREQLSVLERLRSLEPENDNLSEQIQGLWTRMQHPVRALTEKRLREQRKVTLPKPSTPGKKLAPASIPEVAKAVKEARFDDARAIYRRTWRRYQQEDSNRYVIYGWSGVAPMWPEESLDPDPKAELRARGGLLGLDFSERRLDEAPKRRRRSVHEALADLEFGGDELWRQARSLEDTALQHARSILVGLQKAQSRTQGLEAARNRWAAAVRSGAASLIDRALLLSYLEDHAEGLTQEDRTVLADLALSIHPMDSQRMRGLARLYAKLGDRPRAKALLRWCSTLSTGRRWFYGEEQSEEDSTTLESLVREVLRLLDRPSALEALDAILGTPGEESEQDFYFGEDDGSDVLAIRVWTELLAPRDALAKCGDRVQRVLDPKQGLRRSAAAWAARLLIRNGDFDRATRAIEIALCKLEADQVKLDPRFARSASYLLEARNMDLVTLAELVPLDLAPGVDGGAWRRKWLEQLGQWAEKKRILEDTYLDGLVTLAVRGRLAGDVETAREAIARYEKKCGNSSWRRLMLADLLREDGREAQAQSIEEALLAEGVLPKGRLTDVLDRIAKARGDGAAAEVAALAAEWTAAPELLEWLRDTCRRLGRTEDEARWEQARLDAAAAAKELGLEKWGVRPGSAKPASAPASQPAR